jgi:uncharacterized protein (TIGR03437 family)
MKAVYLFLAFWLGGSIVATAQPPRPRVVDIDGRGVAGVEILTTASCLQTIGGRATATISTLTNANGEFSWALFFPGQGSYCGLTVQYSFALKKDGYTFTRSSFSYTPGIFVPGITVPPFDDRIELIQATTAPTWRTVSAASFAPGLTSEMIVAGFGGELAAATAIARDQLPTQLAGRRVTVWDNTGKEQPAKLFFVSPNQINYLMPRGLANGVAHARLLDESGNLLKVSLFEVRPLAPAIFTANADGSGVPAAIVVHVKPGNAQSIEPVVEYDETARRFVAAPIDLGAETDFVVLVLFGTGWRQVDSLSEVRVIAGGLSCPVEYAGAQPTIEGLDQINARLPRALLGRGLVEVRLIIRNTTSNVVQIHIN